MTSNIFNNIAALPLLPVLFLLSTFGGYTALSVQFAVRSSQLGKSVKARCPLCMQANTALVAMSDGYAKMHDGHMNACQRSAAPAPACSHCCTAALLWRGCVGYFRVF